MSDDNARSMPPERLLADASWLRAEPTVRVFDALEQAGFIVRAVGGTVRNTLLGEPVSDIDLATDADPQAVMAAARQAGLKVIPTGITHGTVTIIVAATPFEVTTLRKDVSTDGRRATVAYTNDWAADAARRDFTINAIYCDRNGVLLDPVGGLADIARRQVRFIGDADARIREDYLRILRFFRFSATYAGGVLDPIGLAACIDERAGLHQLSGERIRHELLRLLGAAFCRPVIARMVELGFITDLVGSAGNAAALSALIDNAAGAAAHKPPDDAILRLAALAVVTPDDVSALKQRLRLSNAQAERITLAATIAQSITPQSDPIRLRAFIYRHGNAAVCDAIALCWARHEAKRHASVSSIKTESPPADSPPANAFSAMLAIAATWVAPALPISAHDVLAHGLAPGPRIGGVMKAFERWWIEADFPRDKEQIKSKLAELAVVTNR